MLADVPITASRGVMVMEDNLAASPLVLLQPERAVSKHHTINRRDAITFSAALRENCDRLAESQALLRSCDRISGDEKTQHAIQSRRIDQPQEPQLSLR